MPTEQTAREPTASKYSVVRTARTGINLKPVVIRQTPMVHVHHENVDPLQEFSAPA